MMASRVYITMTPEQRATRGRIGAYAQHAKHDTRETTEKARAAMAAKFTTPEEKSTYYRELALKSVEVRRQKNHQ